MTTLSADINSSQTLLPISGPLTNGTFQYPLHYTIDSEAIRVVGRAIEDSWLVERGIAGTAAASHISGATLTRYFPDAATSGTDSGGVTVTTATLTDAQIKALPTTPVEIVAAPGEGNVIWPIFAAARLNWTADYTNIDAAATMALALGASDISTPLTEEGFNFISNFLAGGGYTHAIFTLAQQVGGAGNPFVVANAGFYDEDIVNLPLNLRMTNPAVSQPLTAGDPANSLKLTVAYFVVANE